MHPSMLCLSAEDKINLWRNDSRFTEYSKIKEEAQESFKTLNFNSEAYKRFSDWNPILKHSDRNFSDLQKHFHPAIVKDHRLFRINDIGVDIFGTAFNWSPKVEEELINVGLVGRFITFHSNGYPLFFKPSIGEVLNQLPQQILDSQGDFCFTTEVIAEDVNQCTVGNGAQYHVAVTSVYRV